MTLPTESVFDYGCRHHVAKFYVRNPPLGSLLHAREVEDEGTALKDGLMLDLACKVVVVGTVSKRQRETEDEGTALKDHLRLDLACEGGGSGGNGVETTKGGGGQGNGVERPPPA